MANIKNAFYSICNSNAKFAFYSFLLLAFFSSSIFSQATGLERVGKAAGCMCAQLMSILPVIAMLMVISAGVVYAAGQLLGAETRARANTWATAMLLGAIIGILIFVVAPAVLDILYGGNGTAVSSTQSAGGLCTLDSCAP